MVVAALEGRATFAARERRPSGRLWVEEVAEGRASEDYEPLSALMESTLDEIEALSAHGIMAGVPTGFVELDELTNGLHPGQMVIVAARPGVGEGGDFPLRLDDELFP